MKTINFIIAAIFLISSAQLYSAQQDKYALVIGNAKYADSPLKNPVNDAVDMAAKLKERGFTVETLLNADKRQMKQAITTFTRKLRAGSVGLFYFAGHGVEVKGENYLLPISADIRTEADVEFEAVNAGRVLANMGDAENSLNMVILDACRNNPYARSFRSSTSGLAKMTAPTGAILMYATKPGDVAHDGNGRNGIFTQHLLAAMDEPGLKAEDVFKKTAANVYRATGKQQFPYIEGVVIGNFYFLPNVKSLPEKSITVPEQRLTDQAELLYWQSVEKNPRKESYEAYLKRWPKGHFAELARLNLQTKQTSESVTEGKTETHQATLTIQEISGMFSDKTVSTLHHFKKLETKRYYSPDGKLTIKVLDSDKVLEAKWTVNNEAKLCHKIQNKSLQCRRVEIDGDEVKLYTPNGQLGMTFSNFRKGNQL